MPYTIQKDKRNIALELSGGVTARDVGELARSLAASLSSESAVIVRTVRLEDIDTSVLQMLVSLRKTAASLTVEEPSEVFVSAVDRCALRRELLNQAKEGS